MTSVAYGVAMPASRGVLGRPVRLLLDSITAAPTAACATWKLRDLYGGPALRVRRSSDNAEQDIGFAGGLLDTTALLAWCGSGNGFITKWYDQSGNARHWAQATAASQPKIVTSGALIADIGGLPSIQFNGSSNWMSGGLAASNYLSAAAYGVMALTRPTSAPADNGSNPTQGCQIFADRSSWIGQCFYSTVFACGHYDTAWSRVTIADTIPSTCITAQRCDGTNIRGWLNGGAGGSAASAGVGSVSGIIDIGRGAFSVGWFAGSMTALIMFNTAPSLGDINTVGADWGARASAGWSTAT